MLPRTLWCLIFVVACKQTAPRPEAANGSAVIPVTHVVSHPPHASQPDLPIDPAKPMPEAGMSTSTALQLGVPATVVVDGRADVYSSGMAQAATVRGGQLPALLTLAPGGGHVTFSNVKGAVGCVSGANLPAEGGLCNIPGSAIEAADGISGIMDRQHSLFMVGVFLGAQQSTEAPPTLDFGPDGIGEAFPELSPKIAQTFFIGDGQTPAGATQRFAVPDGATRLFIGFAVADAFWGPPGDYRDNTGGLNAAVTQQK